MQPQRGKRGSTEEIQISVGSYVRLSVTRKSRTLCLLSSGRQGIPQQSREPKQLGIRHSSRALLSKL